MKRPLVAAGHYGFYAIAVLIPTQSLLSLIRGLGDQITVELAMWALLGTAVAGLLAHTSSLCRRCATCMPLDGAARAARRRRRLYVFHYVADHQKPVVVWVAGALIAGGAAAALWPHLQHSWDVVYAAAVACPGGAWIATAGDHERLRPWCPYCRWGRDDDGPPEPSGPVPGPERHPRTGGGT